MSVIFFLILIGLMLPVDSKKKIRVALSNLRVKNPCFLHFMRCLDGELRGTNIDTLPDEIFVINTIGVGRGPVSKVSAEVLCILFSGKTGEGCVCEAADRRLRVFVCWHPSAPGSEV